MKNLLTILLILLPLSAYAWGVVVTSGGVAAAGAGLSCNTTTPYVTNTATYTNNHQVGGAAWNYYAGTTYTPAANISVCQIDFDIESVTGDVSGKTFVCRIWTLNGTALDTQVAASTGVTGNNSWSETFQAFTFSTAAELSSGTSYGITVDMGGLDASNFIFLMSNAQAVFTGNVRHWVSDKTLGADDSGLEALVKIYRME